jgi:hypothetical protein
VVLGEEHLQEKLSSDGNNDGVGEVAAVDKEGSDVMAGDHVAGDIRGGWNEM